jgi:hypothetical protein
MCLKKKLTKFVVFVDPAFFEKASAEGFSAEMCNDRESMKLTIRLADRKKKHR